MATRKLVVEIVGDSRSLERAFSRSSRSARNFNQDINRHMSGTLRITRSLTGALTGLGAGFIGLAGVGLLVREAFGEMAQAQKATAQTAAVLESTGNAAGTSVAAIEQMSEALMQMSGVDDEVIQSGANMLLTFTQVRNELGRGNDIFDQATRAVLDMSVALGKDMRASALQVGKALQDPVRGITALRRAGVAFTKAQERQIKTLVESGRIVQAQKLIIAELTREFGGSARAAGDTLPGKLNILKESLRNLGGTLATELSPKITEVVDKLNEWLADPQNQQQVINDFTAAVKALADAFVFLKDSLAGVKGAIDDVTSFFDSNRLGFLNQGLRETARDFNDWLGEKLGGANVLGIKDAGENAGKEYGESFSEAAVAAAVPGFGAREGPQGGFPVFRTRPPRPDLRAARGDGSEAAARRAREISRRRQVFDASISRQLDRLQDLGLRKQLARLREIAHEIRARMSVTKDATRRLTLEDRLLGILREQRSVQEQIGDQIRAANQALKDRAEAIKSAVLERLQRRQTDILNKRALQDAREQLRIAKQIGGPQGIKEATRALQDVRFDMLQAKIEAAPARLTPGGKFSLGNVITININGITDPEAVARRVNAILQRRRKRTATQTRGPVPAY